MSKFDWTWICEFCFLTIFDEELPPDWELEWQSAICPTCLERLRAEFGDGWINNAPGGCYAKIPDPRGAGMDTRNH